MAEKQILFVFHSSTMQIKTNHNQKELQALAKKKKITDGGHYIIMTVRECL